METNFPNEENGDPKNSPRIPTVLPKKVTETFAVLHAAADRIPKFTSPSVDAILAIQNSEWFQSLERIRSSVPTIDPEWIQSIEKIQSSLPSIDPEMMKVIDQFNQLRFPAMPINESLLEALRIMDKAPRTIVSSFLLDDWGFPKTFSQLTEELVVSTIDLGEIDHINVHDKAASHKPQIIVEESNKIRQIIADIYRQEKNILTLDPRAFEELIAELLRHQGFQVELTKQTRDGGYDLIALKVLGGNYPLKFLVECKRYTENVGIGIARNLMYVVKQQEANKGIIATTAYFTRDARQLQKSTHPYLLDLHDRDDILAWIRRYGEERMLLQMSH